MPATSHCQPTYTRTINQNHAIRVSANRNRAMGGSGTCEAALGCTCFIILMIFTSVKDEPSRKDTYVERPAKLRLVQGLSFDSLRIPLYSYGIIQATTKFV